MDQLSLVSRAINQLPVESSGLIAVWLQERGFRGRRCSPQDCVVSNYVKEMTGVQAYVAGFFYSVGESEGGGPALHTIMTHHSQALSNFLTEFDFAWYPALLEPGDVHAE
jgi:hypothetical protein